jgi:ribonuclease HI
VNADLWKRLYDLIQTHHVEWNWVRGHHGDPLNERVDALAYGAIPGQSSLGDSAERTGWRDEESRDGGAKEP